MKKILFLLVLLALSFWDIGFAKVVIPGASDIAPVSVTPVAGGGDTLELAQKAGISVIRTVKVILSGLAVLYIVYIGIMMVVTSGHEEKLNSEKRQLMYGLLAFLFINIPGQLYSIFAQKQVSNVTNVPTTNFTDVQSAGSNIFINFFNWNAIVGDGILGFLRVGIIGAAIFMFVLAAIGLITSSGNADKAKEAKGRFLWGSLGLIFMGIIEAWVRVAYQGNIPKGQGIFAQLSNLALFFAGPTAIFFLILGAYYYVTSAGNEDRAKKGKAIVINTFIAVIILLASYAFLKDLSDFRL